MEHPHRSCSAPLDDLADAEQPAVDGVHPHQRSTARSGWRSLDGLPVLESSRRAGIEANRRPAGQR